MSQNHLDQNLLPDFCRPMPIVTVLAFAQLLAIGTALLASPGKFWLTLASATLFMQWVALTTAGVLCLLRSVINQMDDRLLLLCSYGSMLLSCLVVTESSIWLLKNSALSPLTDRSHTELLLRNMGLAAIVDAVVLRVLFLQQKTRRMLNARHLARLEALQARIRPHFLFNSLNNIAGLLRIDADKAEGAIENLAALFRASLRGNTPLVSWREELELCEQYLALEQLRLGGRLQVEWHTESIPSRGQIPLLCLQPLLENAIYHGIEPRPEGGTVTIIGNWQPDLLELTISNPLPETSGYAGHQGHQLTLDNLRERLRDYYGNRNILTTEQSRSGFLVHLSLPQAAHP
ncbi:MAG: histidine kinase [Gammaproteobacteria bacterium]|nr:histidine kinase [Gammaproteobacteria bacterium]